MPSRLAVACQSLPQSAGQAANYAHFPPISQVEQQGHRMLLPAFSEAFSAPKTEIAHAGRVEWRGGPSHCRSCSPPFTQCRGQKILTVPISNENHHAAKPRDLVVRKCQRLDTVRGGSQGKHFLNTGYPRTHDLLSRNRQLACVVPARHRSLTRSRDSACEPLLVTVIHECHPYPNSSHSQRAAPKLKNNIWVP